ncbi:helix-turn-helix domain-containing protein [Slackia heliotrinireducens]|uniref:helix-turn-helix domain-containing protein n=1 Tax=Slackia heliotrinireducens TaxID=84110 RepID=UPI0033154301
MIHAYDDNMRPKAQATLGHAVDFAVNEAGYSPQDFMALFIESGLARRFESGESAVIMGMSGNELALRVFEETVGLQRPLAMRPRERGSKAYWIGWALAFFQWETGLTFRAILTAVPMEVIEDLYGAYHEMDVEQFVDRMVQLYRQAMPDTNLKRLRKLSGLTQEQLAQLSGISVRTIQQYEQRRKDVNKASLETAVAIATVLHCNPSDLLERVAS